jgi:hypothetical protein
MGLTKIGVRPSPIAPPPRRLCAGDAWGKRSLIVRAETRQPKQSPAWILQVLQLFKERGHLTSREVADVAGKISGGDAITRCRQVGLPVEAVGLVSNSRLPRKLYALDTPILWQALQEAVQQIDRYAMILNSLDQSAQRQVFRNPGMWIQHIRQSSTAPKPRRSRRVA